MVAGSKSLLTFEDVRRAELELIRARRVQLNLQGATSKNLTVLCLSGGGIRSAIFSLGVMRGLAKNNLLAKFDIVSSVSGGGFAAAFVTKWAHEVGMDKVQAKLGDDNEFLDPKSPLSHMRRYLSYLTPRMGLSSSDSLALGGRYLSNLMLNWMLVIPYTALAITLVLIVASLYSQTTRLAGALSLYIFCAGISAFLLTYSELMYGRPGWRPAIAAARGSDRFLLFSVLILISSLIFASAAHSTFGGLPAGDWTALGLLVACLLVLLFFFVIQDNWSEVRGVRTSRLRTLRRDFLRWLRRWMIPFAAQAVLLVALIALAREKLFLVLEPMTSVAIAPLALVGSLFVSNVAYFALRGNPPSGDLEREWLAKSTGLLLSLPLAWLCFCLAIFQAPRFIDYLMGLEVIGKTATLGISGIIAALAGYIGTGKRAIDATRGIIKARGEAIILTPFAALVAFLAVGLLTKLTLYAFNLLAGFMHWPSSSVGVEDKCALPLASVGFVVECDQAFPTLAMLALAFLAVALLVDLFSNSNRFSLHDIYRNRIVRTFLGASNFNRKPDPLTDFDPNDNLELASLRTRRKSAPGKVDPWLHIVNMALNVPGSSDLAVQQRKALPFSASQIAVGSKSLPEVEEPWASPRTGYYRAADIYAQNVNEASALGSKPVSLTLGTAVALSGAAFDSQMGHYTTAARSFLLALFNLRLGAWLGNPGPQGEKTYRQASPRLSLLPLLDEVTGRARSDRPFIHLSDGGHFDNLGLFEALARQAKFILVVDASADGGGTLEDLGVADRIAAMDLNARVRFDATQLTAVTKKLRGSAIGTVQYFNNSGQQTHSGTVVLVKPRLGNTDSTALISYGLEHTDFPNESTADQWFTEAQMSAYLSLGEAAVQDLLANRVSIRKFFPVHRKIQGTT
ncbi:patatin-like phospholipase family protein [Mesorhizobium sp. AR02]|uniref:patatin-like phospholipase family protein n=1 Tax=Mesorhizobium sp. AR02 TaxID=2865837 RepID=UPI00215F1A2F|nr:patatin-like phospholipase family protein [Mesorhizobium sp. AR02]UVK51636.1 patatin-like phospholipase family protein [Mesorhizobium sp. AR02]